MRVLVILTISIFVGFSACRKPAIIPDPEIPDLPIYSEKGLNVGGALINGQSWLTLSLKLFSTSRPLQLFSYPQGDSIVVLINGHFKDSSIRYQSPGTIFFILKNIKIADDDDLLQLNGKSYTLDGNTNYGGISDYYGFRKIGKATGNITFGKVSRINNFSYGDGSPNNPKLYPYIVAGQFEMNLMTPNYALTKGRFDVNIFRNSNQFVVY